MINQELHTDEGSRGEESSAGATHNVCLKGKKKEKEESAWPARPLFRPPSTPPLLI
jgi:hypothetical protein